MKDTFYEDFIERMQNRTPIEDPELDRLAEEVIRKGDERKAFLATLTPEELSVGLARQKEEDRQNFVAFVMNTDFGGQ